MIHRFSYRQLLDYIKRMNDEQLDCGVTVHIGKIGDREYDEYVAVHHAELTNEQEEDRLDDGHPVLIVHRI